MRIGLGILLGIVVLFIGLAVTCKPPPVSPEAIRTAVVREEGLLEEAHALPVARTYGETLSWQSNGSRCGPASLLNVFRSLGDTLPDEDAVLDGSGKCWTGVCIMGLTLDELAEIARLRTDRSVTVLRDLTPEAFHEHLRRANEPSRRYVINFSRKPIFDGGGGHHSPIGGYLEAEDLVLVLDVNADFRPWLIERERLYAAMDTLDGERKRGLLLIE